MAVTGKSFNVSFLNVLAGNYVLGASLLNPPPGNYSFQLSFGVEALVCRERAVGWNCWEMPVHFRFGNDDTFTLGNGAEDYFLASILINGPAVGAVTLSTDPIVDLNVRREGYPFTQKNETAMNDGNSVNGQLTMNNPSPGSYFMVTTLAHPSNQTDFKLSSTITSKKLNYNN